MTIQDLAGNLFQTSSSPMLGFSDPPGASTARPLTLRMYRFLIEGIREADQVDGNRFVERFLEGPQQIWEGIDSSIRSLPDMWSVARCADRFLPFLKWIVGWTSELSSITDDLDDATLRRLIATSVPFWKIRGTEESLQEIVGLTSAARTRVINWFDLRYIAGETGLGETHEGHDSWVLPLPGPPDYPEMQLNVRIVDDGTLNRRLVRNLCALTRPAGERVTITYLGFLDLFEVDDDASQWTVSGGGPSPAVQGGSMFLEGAAGPVYANPPGAEGWRNYVVSVTFVSPELVLQVYRQNDHNSYVVHYNGYGILIYAYVSAIPTLLASAPLATPPLAPDSWLTDDELVHTLRVQVTQEGASTRVTASLNGNLIVSATDNTFTQGTFGFLEAFTIELREVEMFFVPIEEDVIDIQSA